MTISTASISENKLSVAYLCKNGSMVIFGEYNTHRLQGRILILLNYDTVAWRNFLMMDLFIVHRIELKKQYLRLHLSNCCAYKPCVFFEIIIRSEQKTVTIHLVKLFRCHACIITPKPGPPGFLFAGYRIATFITQVLFFPYE